ncbi:hypothetical protein [Psychrobacter pacificensis]|jgi:hypothetical protein|uniref:hypothetical protein n=1 Tax=Psychrobacter pacificensis TaxID=112002 RepID=UPI001BB04896|tara:strand:- start:12181 stop:12447 length:267 start_codon:yes stop_codon:yes gene_type:complete
MLRNVETVNSKNNYKIILSEAANSQKRALLKTIVGIIVGIVDIKNNKTYILKGIQPLLYFLPFRPNITVKKKANHCFQWLAFFCAKFY